MEKQYTENFIQSIFNALGDKVKGSTLIVGGDGRYFSKQAINIIIRIASANGVSRKISMDLLSSLPEGFIQFFFIQKLVLFVM